MSGKNQYPPVFNWQSANPITGFLPNPNQGGSVPSGVIAGTCSSTNTIYSQIIDVSKMDNVGLEVVYTGTLTGTLTLLGSNSGVNFLTWAPSPSFTQPSSSTPAFLSGTNQFPFKYMLLQYVNGSGTGTLTVYGQMKDLN